MTYGDIWKEFLEEVKIEQTLINDWRPSCEPWFEANIPYGIIVWLNNGNQIIYISAKAQKMDKGEKK